MNKLSFISNYWCPATPLAVNSFTLCSDFTTRLNSLSNLFKSKVQSLLSEVQRFTQTRIQGSKLIICSNGIHWGWNFARMCARLMPTTSQNFNFSWDSTTKIWLLQDSCFKVKGWSPKTFRPKTLLRLCLSIPATSNTHNSVILIRFKSSWAH